MLDLPHSSAVQLRCIDLFQKHGQERGKSKAGPTFNWKKLSITRGRGEDALAEQRCTTPKAKAARLWLYDNNMTYRHFYELHRTILKEHKAGTRPNL